MFFSIIVRCFALKQQLHVTMAESNREVLLIRAAVSATLFRTDSSGTGGIHTLFPFTVDMLFIFLSSISQEI